MARLQKWGNAGLWVQLPSRRPLSAQELKQRSHHLEKAWERGIGLFPFLPHSSLVQIPELALHNGAEFLLFSLGEQHLWAPSIPAHSMGFGRVCKGLGKPRVRGCVEFLCCSTWVWLVWTSLCVADISWLGRALWGLFARIITQQGVPMEQSRGKKSLQRASSYQTLLETVTSCESSSL